MKKTMKLAVAGIFSAVLITGCGGTEEPSDTTIDHTPNQEEIEDVAKDISEVDADEEAIAEYLTSVMTTYIQISEIGFDLTFFGYELEDNDWNQAEMEGFVAAMSDRLEGVKDEVINNPVPAQHESIQHFHNYMIKDIQNIQEVMGLLVQVADENNTEAEQDELEKKIEQQANQSELLAIEVLEAYLVMVNDIKKNYENITLPVEQLELVQEEIDFMKTQSEE